MEKYRRQGIMRRMLTRCMKDMADQGEVFTYLMPANRLYYEPFDFTIVQYFRTIHTPGTDAGGSKLSVLKPEEYERASDFVNAYCHNNFQVYTKFDPEYLKQLQKETESEHGEMLVWKKHESICGFCCYGCDEETVYVRQIFCDDMDAMIREIKAKFSKKQLELTLCAEKEANGASIMVRILRLDLLMNRISAVKEAELRIQITDSVLESQNGIFRINFSPQGCSLERTDLPCVQTISIQELTKILFGVDCENLLEKYPDYVFGASSPLHYLFVKRHYPALYEKVKSCVRSGRWELLGGMWIESDCNIPCGESLVRQFLHGKNFFRDEFGIEVKNLWLPDTFGYPASLPQIAKLAGCPNFVSQKMSWNQMNSFPYHAFLWRGLDGSELLTHFLPENSYIAFVRPSELIPAETRFNESTVTDEFLSLFGIGDGGGGPKEEYLERALRLRNLEGVPKFHFGRADAFFERLNRHSHSLPLWDGELYFENHRGTLTSQARIKRDNRKLEEMIAASETLWSALPVETYPAEEFERIWKILLLNQFHDILSGTSIQDVYERAACEYADAYTSLACLQKEAATRILTPEKEAITFFNSLNTAYCGFVELPESWDGAGLMQSGTAPVSVQQEGNRQYAAEVTIPPLGFVTFYRRGKAETVREEHPEYPVLENDLVRYLFDGCGRLLSALDKRLKREFIPADCPANAFSLYVDRPTVYEAWNLDKSYRNCQCSEAQIAAPCRVLRGSVRDVIEFHLKIGDSIIEQRVLLGKNSRRLDFVTAVDWREARKVLRVAFPVTVHARESVSDIPFGFVRRPTHTNTSWDAARFEVAIHKYADLSEADFGAALLNDCKYGCCLQGNTIDLSLLRAPKFPDWEADRGEQCFTYSFLPHPNDATTSTVHVEALQLNRPPCCFDGFSGTPELPVAIDSESVELTALKKAEKDSCLVMRLVERGGRHAKAVIRTTLRIQETSMLEWEDGQVMDSSDGTVSITFKPFEIKTFKLLEKEIS